jgi:hypothetical protein
VAPHMTVGSNPDLYKRYSWPSRSSTRASDPGGRSKHCLQGRSCLLLSEVLGPGTRPSTKSRYSYAQAGANEDFLRIVRANPFVKARDPVLARHYAWQLFQRGDLREAKRIADELQQTTTQRDPELEVAIHRGFPPLARASLSSATRNGKCRPNMCRPQTSARTGSRFT